MIEIIRRECVLNPLDDFSALENESGRLIDAVVSSGICGRGYSGARAADRWLAFAQKEGDRELVCLISGECAAALVAENPEAVWTGLACTAKAFGLKQARLVCDREMTVPDSCFGIGFVPFAIKHSLSAGEETLVFAQIEGGIPITRPQPPYPVEKGLFGRPTLIHSAEFFAHLPYLLCGKDVNTKLCRICGDVKSEGIAETVLGTPLREIAGLADAENVRAVQLGGINGVFLAADELGLKYDYEALQNGGLYFGDGSLRVLNSSHCMAYETYKALGEAYRCSCGRCVFCREGLYQLFLLMEDVVNGKATDSTLALIKDISGVIRQNAGCDYGRMTAAMVSRAFEKYFEEIEAHTRSKCASLACPGMFTVHILPDKCKGCGECLARCPVSAISGGEGLIHVIDQTKCTQCTQCMPCAENAIVRAGMQKPAAPDRPIPVGTFVQKKKGLQRRTV